MGPARARLSLASVMLLAGDTDAAMISGPSPAPGRDSRGRCRDGVRGEPEGD
jgi:hypothetical protein